MRGKQMLACLHKEQEEEVNEEGAEPRTHR